jgi:hypothetical protein
MIPDGLAHLAKAILNPVSALVAQLETPGLRGSQSLSAKQPDPITANPRQANRLAIVGDDATADLTAQPALKYRLVT